MIRLSHVNVSMSRGPEAERIARAFYTGILGLPEIPKPLMMRANGGLWFDANGQHVHLSVEEPRSGPDAQRHFGMEFDDIELIRAKLISGGFRPETASPAPWQRFFVNDPFGNRIEIHELGGLSK
jgi:catechol 2,3-dioxygenase-like lactoylglutathione lyase family enzyme